MANCAVPGCLDGLGAWGGAGRQEVKWLQFPKDPAASEKSTVVATNQKGWKNLECEKWREGERRERERERERERR